MERENALRNSSEAAQLLLPMFSPSILLPALGVVAVTSILQMGKLRLATSAGSHSESLMGLVLAASLCSYMSPSAGVMTAEGRSSKPRALWVGGHLGAPPSLAPPKLTGLGKSIASVAWGAGGTRRGRAAGRGSLLLETSLPFPRLLPLTVMALEFQTTLVFCKEVSGLCERQPQTEPSRSSASSLPSI